MSVAKTLADVGEDLTLECGSVVRVRPVPAYLLVEIVEDVLSSGVVIPIDPPSREDLEKWFADPKQRQEIAVAAAERYCGQLLPLIRRVAFTSPKVICAVCGISSDEFRAMISLRDIAAILAKVLAAMQSDVFAETVQGFFSQFGGLTAAFGKSNQPSNTEPGPATT